MLFPYARYFIFICLCFAMLFQCAALTMSTGEWNTILDIPFLLFTHFHGELLMKERKPNDVGKVHTCTNELSGKIRKWKWQKCSQG